jgi:putative two-component system response regulator
MPTVLIVEDDPDMNEVLYRLLQKAGYKALSAFTGEGGLAMVIMGKPDLIVLDHMMPGMDGMEMLRMLRGNPQTALIPVVIYSGVEIPTTPGKN